MFTTSRDLQNAVRIVVCQGESRRLDNNTVIGDLRLEGLPPRPRGETSIEVTFSLDASGILQVTRARLADRPRAERVARSRRWRARAGCQRRARPHPAAAPLDVRLRPRSGEPRYGSSPRYRRRVAAVRGPFTGAVAAAAARSRRSRDYSPPAPGSSSPPPLGAAPLAAPDRASWPSWAPRCRRVLSPVGRTAAAPAAAPPAASHHGSLSALLLGERLRIDEPELAEARTAQRDEEVLAAGDGGRTDEVIEVLRHVVLALRGRRPSLLGPVRRRARRPCRAAWSACERACCACRCRPRRSSSSRSPARRSRRGSCRAARTSRRSVESGLRPCADRLDRADRRCRRP